MNLKNHEEIKKGLECAVTEVCKGKCACPYYNLEAGDCIRNSRRDALAYIQQLEAERDALKDALGLMVYQYCVRGDKLDHMFMCAGENAFRVLGLEQYGDANTLEGWLFPEPSKEE